MVCGRHCLSMTALLLGPRGPIGPLANGGFEVSYVPDGGAEHRVPLAQASAVSLEQGIPVRRFTSRKGQRHLSGLWWSATTGGHVGFESWLETRSCAASGFRPVRGRHRVAAVVAALDRRGGLPSAEPRWPNKYIEYQVISLPRAARGKLRAIQSKTVDIRHSGLSQ